MVSETVVPELPWLPRFPHPLAPTTITSVAWAPTELHEGCKQTGKCRAIYSQWFYDCRASIYFFCLIQNMGGGFAKYTWGILFLLLPQAPAWPPPSNCSAFPAPRKQRGDEQGGGPPIAFASSQAPGVTDALSQGQLANPVHASPTVKSLQLTLANAPPLGRDCNFQMTLTGLEQSYSSLSERCAQGVVSCRERCYLFTGSPVMIDSNGEARRYYTAYMTVQTGLDESALQGLREQLAPH